MSYVYFLCDLPFQENPKINVAYVYYTCYMEQIWKDEMTFMYQLVVETTLSQYQISTQSIC